jgi:hypothetical protein
MAIQPKKEVSNTFFKGTMFELKQTNAIKNDNINVVRIRDSTIQIRNSFNHKANYFGCQLKKNENKPNVMVVYHQKM